MPRYKPRERHSLMLPVELSEQIVPGSFAFALDYLVEHELDFSAMDAAPLCHNKHLARLNLRGRENVNTQWHLYCMVHNIEKLANSGWKQ